MVRKGQGFFEIFNLVFLTAQLFVAFFYRCGGIRLQTAERLQQFGWIIGFELKVSLWTYVGSWCRNYNDRNLRLKGLNLANYLTAGDVFQAPIEDDSADSRKSREDFQCLLARVGRQNVEFSGFDHELAGGDTAGKLPVDNKKTGPVHVLY